MKLRAVLVAAMLGGCHAAFAEGGCPPGQYPYDTPQARQCVPIPGGGPSTTSQPTVIYEDRWGAIFIDATVSEGGIGTVTGFPSKRKAEQAALAQCRTTGGGKGCKLSVSYRNQCAAIGWGNNRFTTWTGLTVESASALAMNDCKKKDTNCRIYYSGCSYPVRAQ